MTEEEKLKRRLYQREWKAKNRLKVREYAREYRNKNVLKFREASKQSYRKHKDKILIKNKIYREKNKEIISQKKKIYNKENFLRFKKYAQNRLKTNIDYRILKNIRTRLYISLKSKNTNKDNKTMTYVGCSKEELKLHLQSLFTEGMTWGNYGEWHIDHKIPLSSFNLKIDEEIHKAMHYTNLQPLWAKDNLSKGNKYFYGATKTK